MNPGSALQQTCIVQTKSDTVVCYSTASYAIKLKSDLTALTGTAVYITEKWNKQQLQELY